MFGLDKYADTVLLAYGVSIVILAILIWATLVKSQKVKAQLSAQEAKNNG